MKKIEISEAQLKSYIRAENVCRELRFHWTDARNETRENKNILSDLFMTWFRGCKKIKYDRPIKA